MSKCFNLWSGGSDRHCFGTSTINATQLEVHTLSCVVKVMVAPLAIAVVPCGMSSVGTGLFILLAKPVAMEFNVSPVWTVYPKP